MAVPPAFYLCLWAAGVPIAAARSRGWFFEQVEAADPLLMWRLLDLRLVDWGLVSACAPTIMALTVFRSGRRKRFVRYRITVMAVCVCLCVCVSVCGSLMHVPINIPSLSISTKREVDINREVSVNLT